MKSKMPWPPGFIPVMKLDQATGLCGGVDVLSRRKSRLGGELGERRQLPLFHPDFGEVGVHAVEAEDEDSCPGRRLCRMRCRTNPSRRAEGGQGGRAGAGFKE